MNPLNTEPDPKLAGLYVDGGDPATLTTDILILVDGTIAFSETLTLKNAEDKWFDFTGDDGPDCRTNCLIAARVRDHSDWVQWDPTGPNVPQYRDQLREPCYGVEIEVDKQPTIMHIGWTPFPFDC